MHKTTPEKRMENNNFGDPKGFTNFFILQTTCYAVVKISRSKDVIVSILLIVLGYAANLLCKQLCECECELYTCKMFHSKDTIVSLLIHNDFTVFWT